jgi:hypothetical protein
MEVEVAELPEREDSEFVPELKESGDSVPEAEEEVPVEEWEQVPEH